jgi:Leucine-rich repeat (LRR) protein
MRIRVLTFFGISAIGVFLCTPGTVKHDTADTGKNVSPVTAAPVKETAAAVIDTIAGAPAPVADTTVAVPRYNDTAVVKQILNECGLVTVKAEQVTAWDSSGRAVSLDLSNTDRSQDGFKVLPAAVCSLTKLQTLIAKDNSIDVIPLELFRLKSLRKLDLASNKISFIPSTIGELDNLEILDLRYNGFGYLPPEIGKLKKLVSLQLWGNKMVELEPAVTQLPELKELYLKDNRLTALPDAITLMKSLKYFDLQGNSICNPSKLVDAWLKKDDKRYREGQRCR